MWKFLVLGLLVNTLLVTSANKIKKTTKPTNEDPSDYNCPEETTSDGSTEEPEAKTTTNKPTDSVKTTTVTADSCGGDANATSGCDVKCKQRCVPLKDNANCDCPKNSCRCKENYYFDTTSFSCVLYEDCSNNNSNDKTTTPYNPETTPKSTTLTPTSTTTQKITTASNDDKEKCEYSFMQFCDADTTTAATTTTTKKIPTSTDKVTTTTENDKTTTEELTTTTTTEKFTKATDKYETTTDTDITTKETKTEVPPKCPYDSTDKKKNE